MSSIFRPTAKEKSTPIESPISSPEQSGSSIFRVQTQEKAVAQPSVIQQETPGEENRRDVARKGARVTEAVLGSVPGLIESVARAGNWVAGKIPGMNPASEEEMESAFKYNPTPGRIRKWHETFTGEYLQPQSESEAYWDEATSDITSLLTPLPGAGKAKAGANLAKKVKDFGKKVFKMTGLEGAALGAKEGAQKLGLDEENSQWVKMGTLLTGNLLLNNGIRGADKYKNALYSEAKNLRPQNAFVNARNFDRNIRGLQRNLQLGTQHVGSKAKSLQFLKDMRDKISRRGTISVEELEEFKRNVNEARAHLYEDFKVDKVGRRLAKRNLDSVSEIVDKSLEDYGRTNTQWYKKYTEANNAHAAIEQSKKASRFIARNAKPIGGGAGGTALLEVLSGHPEALIPTAVGALAGGTTLKAVELGVRIWKSPTLRKYYMNVLQGALKEDASFMNQNLLKLQQELEKED